MIRDSIASFGNNHLSNGIISSYTDNENSDKIRKEVISSTERSLAEFSLLNFIQSEFFEKDEKIDRGQFVFSTTPWKNNREKIDILALSWVQLDKMTQLEVERIMQKNEEPLNIIIAVDKTKDWTCYIKEIQIDGIWTIYMK